MRTTDIRRRAVAAIAVAALGTAGAAVGPAAPAHAGGSPVRAEDISAHDGSPTKIVDVDCPGARSIYAAGARIFDGNGAVILTAMVPDPTLTSVTVTATARTGHVGDWSLRAYAVCDVSTSLPVLVEATADYSSTATATCPDETRLVGSGFQLEGAVDLSYLNELTFGPGLRQTRVSAGGLATPTSITAFGICKEPTQPSGPPGVRVEATSAHDATWPKTISVGDATGDTQIYAVGATAVGQGELFITALVPNLNQHAAFAEVDQATAATPAAGNVVPGAGGSAAIASAHATILADEAADGEGAVTVCGLLMSTFH